MLTNGTLGKWSRKFYMRLTILIGLYFVGTDISHNPFRDNPSFTRDFFPPRGPNDKFSSQPGIEPPNPQSPLKGFAKQGREKVLESLGLFIVCQVAGRVLILPTRRLFVQGEEILHAVTPRLSQSGCCGLPMGCNLEPGSLLERMQNAPILGLAFQGLASEGIVGLASDPLLPGATQQRHSKVNPTDIPLQMPLFHLLPKLFENIFYPGVLLDLWGTISLRVGILLARCRRQLFLRGTLLRRLLRICLEVVLQLRVLGD